MSSKGYKHTKDAIKRITLAQKGNQHCLGNILTDTHKNRIKEGVKNSLPVTIFKKGFTPWNKGIKTGFVPKSAFKEGHIIPKDIRQKIRLSTQGSKGNAWKGGITPLTQMIRSLIENREWIKSVFQRDNYTCQECFVLGGKLHAHHKKPFALIFREFLQLYSQFSPIDDKEILVRLAITYQPFWDIDNGETKCANCHRRITHLERQRIN